jgi:hypothetical protein
MLFLLLSGAICAQAGPVMIGYTNCLGVTNYPQSVMNQIGQLRWFFAHASVGANLVDGLTTLHALNPGFYQIYTNGAPDTDPYISSYPTPANTTNGVFYEYMRGNYGWKAKVDSFRTYVTNGWRFPKVNIAINKFCWIDQTADLAYYLSSMTNLEAAFPETLFVYVTMPLNTATNIGAGYDGLSYLYQRNLFNDGLRDWVRANNRVLYDIADIESHDPSGVPCVFTYNGRVCQAQYPGYSADGGHLNAVGKALAAQGIYALAGALLATDRDGDGVSDGTELLAGTRPFDAASAFRCLSFTRLPSGAMSVRWTSSSNRLYTVQRRAASLAGTFSNIVQDLPATPPINTYTDAPPNSAPVYYRIQVRQ